MAKQLIQYQLEDKPDSPIIVVEVVNDDFFDHSDGAQHTADEEGKVAKVTQKAKDTFSNAISILKPVSQKILTQIKGLSPDEIKVELGIKFDAQVGAIIASSSAEANIKVILTWNKGTVSTLSNNENGDSPKEKEHKET
ncbi:MAG: CU044_2847 family protein [Bacteroidia bacterium]